MRRRMQRLQWALRQSIGYTWTMSVGDSEPASSTVRQREAADPLLGTILGGKYRILSVMARGGTGKVYQAKQEPIGRTVAVKVMRPDLDPEGRDRFEERFLREASQAGQLQHPNVVTVHDFGRAEDGSCFIVMEHLGGHSLKRVFREGPLPPERALHIFEQITRGLRHAHRHGLVHRDMKPGNVMLLKGDDGTDYAKVLDFGLVKGGEDSAITRDGTFLGTPHYVSPEQARGKDADGRSDLYSLGVMMYRALTGKLPFYAQNNPMAIAISHVRDPYPEMATRAPEVTVAPEIEAVVERLMSKRPDERFPDADALLLALIDTRHTLYPSSHTVEITSVITGDPVGSLIDTETGSLPPGKRRGGVLGLGALLLVGTPLAVGGAVGAWALMHPEEAPIEEPMFKVQEAVEILAEEPELPAVREVYVLVSSEPSGAELWLDGELLGKTPVATKVTVPTDEIELTRQAELRLSGFRDTPVVLDLSGDEATAHGALRTITKAAPASVAASAAASTPAAAPPAAPAPQSAVRADGVSFTAGEATRALVYLNNASKAELTAAGMAGRQSNIAIDKRPWASIEAFASTPYIGEKTVEALKRAVQ